jgi:hypothetical protein
MTSVFDLAWAISGVPSGGEQVTLHRVTNIKEGKTLIEECYVPFYKTVSIFSDFFGEILSISESTGMISVPINKIIEIYRIKLLFL